MNSDFLQIFQPEAWFPMAKWSRAGVWECWSAPLVHVRTCLRPMGKNFCRVQKKHSKRVMGYWVCQLILCYNKILIGEWQSLLTKQLGQAENLRKRKKVFQSIFICISQFVLFFLGCLLRNISRSAIWQRGGYLVSWHLLHRVCSNGATLPRDVTNAGKNFYFSN